MSGGDFATVRKQAEALGLGCKDNGDGTLAVGPVSAGDQASMENLAASLQIPVEVVITPGTVPEQPEQQGDEKDKQIAELNAKVAQLEAEDARLKDRESALSQDIIDLNAEISRLLKIIRDAIAVLTGA